MAKPYSFTFKRRTLKDGWCEALVNKQSKWVLRGGRWVRKSAAPTRSHCDSVIGQFYITVQGKSRRTCGIHSVIQRQDAIYRKNRKANRKATV